jgi:hypothetical protein
MTPLCLNQLFEIIPNIFYTRQLDTANNLIDARVSGRKAIELLDKMYEGISYRGKRYKTYQNYMKDIDSKKEYHFYDVKKKRFKELFAQGVPIMEIAKIIEIPFQTLYKWRKVLGNT